MSSGGQEAQGFTQEAQGFPQASRENFSTAFRLSTWCVYVPVSV